MAIFLMQHIRRRIIIGLVVVGGLVLPGGVSAYINQVDGQERR